MDEVNQANKHRIQRFRQQNYEWLLTHKDKLTHAVTLTFDPAKIRTFLRQHKLDLALNNDYLVQCYQQEMRYFSQRLSKSLFGNSAQRHGSKLLLIPVLEGLEHNAMPHYHCAIGVDASRQSVVTDKIIGNWQQTRFSGYHHDVKPYRDEGWLAYITKKCFTPNIDVIDWMNVSVPASSQSTPE
jgi:hypothetical protein